MVGHHAEPCATQELADWAKALYARLAGMVELYQQLLDLLRTIHAGGFIQTSLESFMRVMSALSAPLLIPVPFDWAPRMRGLIQAPSCNAAQTM